jgi:hypothetical protein
MKKSWTILGILISILILSFCIRECSAQQNGTFKNAYIDTIRPIYPTTLGLNIINRYNPVKISINDTLLIPYIKFHSGSGGGGTLDSSKFVLKSDVNNVTNLGTQVGLLSQTTFNNSFAQFLLSPESDLIQLTLDKSLLSSRLDFNYSGLSYGANYGARNTSNSRWLPDKRYVDSLFTSTTPLTKFSDFSYLTATYSIPLSNGIDSVPTDHTIVIPHDGKYSIQLSGMVRYANFTEVGGYVLNVGFGVNDSGVNYPEFNNILYPADITIVGEVTAWIISVNIVRTLHTGDHITINAGFTSIGTASGIMRLSQANLSVIEI